ncbi:MAG: isoamylase [Planctomycetia bacterium]|nr:isoamylase [Planctomycetia bacterium]
MIQAKTPQMGYYPLVFGADLCQRSRPDGSVESGVFFRVVSRSATQIRLLVYDSPGSPDPSRVIPFPEAGRWGDCHSLFVPGLEAGTLYHFQADGPWDPEAGLRFDGRARLMDPYARAVIGEFLPPDDGIVRPPKCVVVDDTDFDWEGDRPVNRPLADTIICELHVRGFTKQFPFARPVTTGRSNGTAEDSRGLTSGTETLSGISVPGTEVPEDGRTTAELRERRGRESTEKPVEESAGKPATGRMETSEIAGTYRGLIETIPYLLSLGVTAIELMPIHAFAQTDPTGQVTRRNYWGYDTIAFFAPHPGYAADKTPGGAVREFREMVRAFHRAGIEVILDVVFNHTAEGNERGPTFGLKGLENPVYYMLDHRGHYQNYSGCGNTINGNHPIVRAMIFDCLKYWVMNYHIDGFRFDLASILTRDRDGKIMANSPSVEYIAEDPLLADTKLIAEAWDAAGAYQVGHFHSMRWAEWNGRYRDDVRRFWRGDSGLAPVLATRIAGSSDLYAWNGRTPAHSINFIAAHDGFTLHDLVSYNEKHNLANREGNMDGDNNGFSWNHGVEGETDDPVILARRAKEQRNFLATLLLSQGVPMLLAGDEVGRTQRGNNNAYCQDNELSWFDWKLVEKNASLWRFVSGLTRLRRTTASLRRERFLTGHPETPEGLADVEWYGGDGESMDWSRQDGDLTLLLRAEPSRGTDDVPRHLLIMIHQRNVPQYFSIPKRVRELEWRRIINTAAEPPDDFHDPDQAPRVNGNVIRVHSHSMIVLVADAV